MYSPITDSDTSDMLWTFLLYISRLGIVEIEKAAEIFDNFTDRGTNLYGIDLDDLLWEIKSYSPVINERTYNAMWNFCYVLHWLRLTGTSPSKIMIDFYQKADIHRTFKHGET